MSYKHQYLRKCDCKTYIYRYNFLEFRNAFISVIWQMIHVTNNIALPLQTFIVSNCHGLGCEPVSMSKRRHTIHSDMSQFSSQGPVVVYSKKTATNTIAIFVTNSGILQPG